MSAIIKNDNLPASIRNNKIPSPLFKYVTTERALHILNDRSIRFTQPAAFNDPFEFHPTLNLGKIKAKYLALDHVQELIRSGKDRRSVMRGFPDFTRGFATIFVRDLETVCALCLSRRCDIPLQWSHYADQHRGVAIGLRINDAFIRDSCNRSTPSHYCDCGPIQYRPDRLQIPGDETDPLHHMFVKDKCWSYEEEWRVVKSRLLLRLVGNGIYVTDFEPEAVRCVVRGLMTPENDWNEIRKVLMKPEYNHVAQYAVQFDSHTFDLDVITSIGATLDYGDVQLEASSYSDAHAFYKLTSKGELYKAMEILPQETEFRREKEAHDFNP